MTTRTKSIIRCEDCYELYDGDGRCTCSSTLGIPKPLAFSMSVEQKLELKRLWFGVWPEAKLTQANIRAQNIIFNTDILWERE
ncbi:hypothetical protein LCGC14_2343270 [marine sediment metagenome]|uniref:Uncharacterized protein n=1 Tax=marine sediment metagenome TaxID=412755 RepID=A0A0F9CC59_9ZZZZ